MRSSLFLLLLFLWNFSFGQQNQYPKLRQIVTDEANVFTQTQLDQLRQKLSSYEAEKTHQVVVLTISSLQGETIEGYANAVFNRNQLGQKDQDNGVLIVLAKEDRQVRIEVGYGLEHLLTDALSKRIIEQQMIPQFKEENYYEGINLGTDTIMNIIDDPEFAAEFAKDEPLLPIWGKVLLMLFVGGFLSLFFFFGGKAFLGSYKNLINTYRGVLTGKIGLLPFPLMTIGTLISLIVSLVFLLMPLLFFWVFLSAFALEIDPFESIETSGLLPYLNQTNLVMALLLLLVVVPLALALYRMKGGREESFGFSWTKNDKSFMKKHLTFSASGRSGSSSRSYSSSSSSFSGGGGSSGGGGASGSW